MGVDTPSALASFASRWGGNGAFGGRHVGDRAASGLAERVMTVFLIVVDVGRRLA
jgi:hypothetical protein